MKNLKEEKREWMRFYDKSTFLLYLWSVVLIDVVSLSICGLPAYRLVVEHAVGTERIADFVLLAMFGGLFLCTTGLFFYKKDAGKVHLLWCADAEGIHCKGIGWPSFSFRWDEIKFIAVSQYMYGLYEHFAIAFCLDSEYHGELVPKYWQSADEHCIIFDYTPEVWAELKDNLPDDVARRMQEALDKHKSVYIRKGGKQ